MYINPKESIELVFTKKKKYWIGPSLRTSPNNNDFTFRLLMHVVSGSDSDRDRDSSLLIRLSIHQTPSSIRFRRMRFSGTRQRERERERETASSKRLSIYQTSSSIRLLLQQTPSSIRLRRRPISGTRERESTEREWTGFFPFWFVHAPIPTSHVSLRHISSQPKIRYIPCLIKSSFNLR